MKRFPLLLACVLTGGLAFCQTSTSQEVNIVEQESIAPPAPLESHVSPPGTGFLFPPLSTINVFDAINPGGRVPPDNAEKIFERATPVDTRDSRNWYVSVYSWKAPITHSNPLYFEEVALERYGQPCCCRCLQPVFSSAHFFGNTMALPAKMVCTPPCTIQYTLGRFRPGGPTPSRIPGLF